MEQAWAPPRDVACLVGWMAMVGAPPGYWPPSWRWPEGPHAGPAAAWAAPPRLIRGDRRQVEGTTRAAVEDGLACCGIE
jgi:hypothetical protein